MAAKRPLSFSSATSDLRLAKGPRVSQADSLYGSLHQSETGSLFSHSNYTIAWICALHLELAASRRMLDSEHAALPARDGDHNVYVLGNIGKHNVVMAALPGIYGKVNAAALATDLKRSFPNVRATLMVGIGGGAPAEADLYLGDVVVGTRVMEYDLGKATSDGGFESTADPKRPSTLLLNTVTNLRSKHGQDQWSSRAQELLESRLAEYARPDQPDILFQAGLPHPKDARTCEACDKSKLQPRKTRLSNNFHIHYGGIASGDSVNKDARKRDVVSRKLNVLCFEMEAAGIMDSLGCLPIRGICDYSDSHKNKEWQNYAAATAASYARELLETIPPLAEPRESSFSVRDDFSDSIAGTVQSSEAEERRKTLLGALDFPQMNFRKDGIGAQQGKTCRWFLNHAKFQTWANTKDTKSGLSSLLHIRGKAGAGKSTLMKFLFTEAKKSHKGAVVAFFFNARGADLEKSIEGMYRSILKQILTVLPDLLPVSHGSIVNTASASRHSDSSEAPGTLTPAECFSAL